MTMIFFLILLFHKTLMRQIEVQVIVHRVFSFIQVFYLYSGILTENVVLVNFASFRHRFTDLLRHNLSEVKSSHSRNFAFHWF